MSHDSYTGRQQQVFTNWINAKVKTRGLHVDDILEDLKSGVVLYNLLEELSHQSLAPLGKLSLGQTQIHRNVNMSIVFRYLTQTIKMVGIGPADIVEGNPSLTLGLIWSIIVFFAAKDVGEVVDLKAFKAKVLRWVQRLTEPYTDVHVTNLTSSLANGHALNAIMNRVAPTKFKYAHKPTAQENLERVFDFSNKEFGVAQLLDPTDPHCCDDEKVMLTYLAEMMSKLPAPPGEYSAGDVASVIDNLNRTPEQRVEFFTEHAVAAITSDLETVCKISSVPTDADACLTCVQAFEQIAQSKGLGTPILIAPTSESEDPSCVGSPFLLVSSPPAAPEKPVVLVYTSYGVDPATLEDSSWAAAPFECTLADGRMIAAGSASGKAESVAALTALQSLGQACDEEPPATVRVLSGPTLSLGPGVDGASPAQRLAGRRLQEFLAAHSNEIGQPDVILVADAGSTLAPGMPSVQYGVRGEAAVTVTLRLFNGRGASAALHGGVFLDAAQALVGAVNSLRDPATGRMIAELPRAYVSESIREGLAAVQYTAETLKQSTGYLGEVSVPSVVEALCFEAGVSIASLQYTAEEGVLGAVASARLIFSVPPGVDAAVFLQHVENKIRASIASSADLTFSEHTSVTGWMLNAETSALPLVKSALASGTEANSAFCATSPVFDPISTAFARAFPLAQVFMIGANDPAANPHGPNESVLIPAVAKSAAQTAKIVLALKDVAFVRVAGEGAVVDETAEVGAEIETKAAEEVVLETEAQIVEEVEAQADAEIVEEVTVETEAAIVEEVVAETEAAIVEEAAVEMEVAVEAEASTVEETAPGASADAEVVEVVVTEERVVEAAIPDATTEAAPEEFTEVATEASVHASGIDDMEEYSHPKHLVQEDDPYLTYEQGLVEPPITTENQGEAPFEFV